MTALISSSHPQIDTEASRSKDRSSKEVGVSKAKSPKTAKAIKPAENKMLLKQNKLEELS